MDRYDFRSDTVTWPTPAMRAAMAEAAVGDDVYGEDPTVNRLEAMAAERLGMEAGLFVASGTMGNLVSILAHATRGDEAIVGDAYHTFNWEAGGMATLGGIVPRPLPVDAIGRMDPALVEAAVRPVDNAHLPHSALICVENTCGGRYGAAIPADYFAELRQVADRHDLRLHLDGARLFNAAAALGVPASDLTAHVDSVSFCLSKGLSAPAGSVVCGSADFIYRAHRWRKAVGGGMRQAGVMAAAGIVALETMTERLVEDHARARRLARGLAAIPGVEIDLSTVYTNMIFFDLAADAPHTAGEVAAALIEHANVWVNPRGARSFRVVTHYWIDDDAVDALLHALRHILTKGIRGTAGAVVGAYAER